MVKTIKKDGYNLHIIKTRKFKTVSLRLTFWNKLKEDELTIRNMLADSLLFSSFKYNDTRKMSIKKEELYNVGLYSSTYRNGTHIFTEFDLSCIEDKYTQKDNLEEAIKFMFECLNNPNVSENAFNSANFNVVKNHLKNAIKSEVDNPNYYAYRRYKEIIGNSEILKGSILGTLEDLVKITEKTLYEYYKSFFENNHIDIYVIGNIKEKEIERIIDQNMKFKSHINNYLKISTDYEKEYTEDIEQSNFHQSKLLMGSSIKSLTQHEKKYTAILYNIILGNSPNSKLFQSVREKKSYAYTISSSINRIDGMFTITAGISSKNYEDTKKEVLKQLKSMKNGEFTQKDIKNAKEIILSILKEINDNPISIIDHYKNYLYIETDSVEEEIKYIKEIKKDDIIKVAKKINIDTIYLLKEDGNEWNKNK